MGVGMVVTGGEGILSEVGLILVSLLSLSLFQNIGLQLLHHQSFDAGDEATGAKENWHT